MCFYCVDDGQSLFGLRRPRPAQTFVAEAVDVDPKASQVSGPESGQQNSQAGSGLGKLKVPSKMMNRKSDS